MPRVCQYNWQAERDKIRYEPFKGRVLFHTTYSEYFKENVHLFDALDFLAELTQYLPPKGVQLIRRYGLYSSRTKGRWSDMPRVVERAPAGWRKAHLESIHDQKTTSIEPLEDTVEVELTERKQAWALLLAKIYEVDPFVCPRCGSDMKVVAVIEDPDEIRRILRHLIKIGRSPPGLDLSSLN